MIINNLGIIEIIATAAIVILSVLAGYLLRKRVMEGRLYSAEKQVGKIVEEARKEADIIKKEALIQAKDAHYQAKAEFERETRERRSELSGLEKRLSQKEENLEKKVDLMDRKENELNKREKSLVEKENSIGGMESHFQHLIDEARRQLEELAGISSKEAKKRLMQMMEEDAKLEAAKTIKRIEEETRENADKKAKDIIGLAIQRYAGEYVAERTVSVVNLPNDEMKGRIIGREGRNIRAIEAVTGIDLIIDDTPEAVIISGHNPVRREVARLSLERLIADGRIHPSRIEEVVEKVRQEVDQGVREAGEQAAFDVGVHNIHSELIKLVGQLRYRTSFAQNVLQHSIEVAFLCGIMASELGVNVKQAKRAGLLHDIGKAVDHEVEGSHASIGGEIARKYGESPHIVHAILAHHDEEKPNSLMAVLVQAADALSAARPGARREMLETYVKRLEDLERIANSFPGIEKSYAVQAGRELRIIVESDKISDDQSVILCREIARKVESELSYPGQIKVTVVRETRAVDYAR